MVRVAIAGDVLCQQCHGSWFILNDSNDANPVNDTNALLTHPVVTDYATFAAANSTDYNAAPSNASNGGSGEVRLVDGGVSCTSCHGTHYADSSSDTTDGTSAYNDSTMAKGDGNILRADGPLRMTGTPALPGPRNGATGTAQLRSNLCQSCHKIELHGQGVSGDHQIGCLDCHGGHAYNSGTPNAYILNKMTPDAVPTRIDRVNGVSVQITFPDYPNGGSTRTQWADENQGETGGFCEKCHGDCNSVAMVAAAAEHEAGNTNECNACHKHNDPADIYSFNRDASAATCGQCHGFPPYLNVPGDRVLVPANDGGYAENNSGDANTPYDYVTSTTHEKDETLTGHKVHAGRDLPTSPANTEVTDWYFVGVSGVDNCKVCHGPDAGTSTGGHREAPATRPNTFRDVPFDGIAKHGGMSPAYNVNSPWTCSSVYCHTNGAPYDSATRPSRVYTRVNTTPSWVGGGTSYAAGGYGSIHGKAYECASCHGNTAATMATGVDPLKSNSVAHLAHLGWATTLNMAKTFSCSVCHVQSAASSTALAVNAMDGRVGGEHVNGEIDVDFATGTTPNTLPEALTGSTYTAASGVCSTYCHNVTGAIGAMAADWDIATDMQCDSCHGGLATDIAGNGGYGAITTDSHSRHILTTGTGPKLACAECHGTGSDAGTHAGHFDGQINMKPPVNGVTFADICQECHGYDAEVGEILPVWGSPATTDCATCHAGLQCGETFNGKSPLPVDYARTSGHNRPTSAGAYAQTANPAANLNCSDCHVTDHAGHWDGTSGDDMMLISGGGFPATYAGNENNFCGSCHGAAGTAVKTNINTHQSKLCVACHNVHGDQNIQMIWLDQNDQVNHDPSATGKYAANVLFSNVIDFTAGNFESYDEDDGAVGGAGEANSDDLCATCHTTAAGTTHNNVNNSTGDHYQGGDCFTCHASHTDNSDAFKLGAGTACNDCHGFPPATGAHRKGTLITDPELHSNTSGNLDIEDRSDCAFCHIGADLYTYDLGADQGSANVDRNNHGVSQAVRRTVLTAAVGYEATNFSCTTACHASNNGDGEWDDVSGLNCNACHYAAASPSSAGNVTANNSEAVSAVHNKHFNKNAMSCAQCHDVSYSAGITAIRGVLTHIIAPDYSGAGNDGTLVQGRANALLDEATVVRSSMTYSGGVADAAGANNSCAGTGFGLGCHASGTADWDVVIPATSAGCVMCHTETNTAAYNPVSGIHDNSPSGPTVTGNAHDGSFDNGSAGTADCVTCHTSAPTTVAANHINGTLNTGTAIAVAGAVGYTQGTGTCATTCHSAGTTWAYKWATSAYNTNGSECANCHGDYATGWVTGVSPHTEFPTRGNKHNNIGNLTYPCSDCHAIGTAGYKWISKWDPTGTNSNHGDDKITMNQTAANTFAIDTAPTPDRAGCTTGSCHGNTAAYNFRITTTALTTQTVSGTEPAVLCSGCHGGTAGTNSNGYWPDGVNTAGDNATEDNSGAHLKHMTVLAKSKYNETIAQLLTDNGNGTSDTKQKVLCSYCHGTVGNPLDATHGQIAYLPADVTSMYAQWDTTQTTPDNGVWSIANRTCATVDCHFNKTTPTTPTSYTWYSGSTSACIMCHVDVTAEAKHTAHTGGAATFGRTIGCADCHEAATNWGTNAAPATGHLDNAYTVAGSVAFTYDGSKSCGTNDCHEDGKGGAPKTASYPWNGAALGNCTICHDASPTTDAHTVHLAGKVSSYVSGSCNDCHPAASNVAHINNSVSYAAKLSAAPGNGSCTNTCHLSPEAGDWTGGAAAITCTDCHSGSGASAYIGGDKTSVPGPNYMPQYAMHLTVPTVSGKVHTDTGLSTTCEFCHSTMAAQAANHPNGTWTADDADNTNDQNRGMFAAFSDGTPATCATTCHSAGTSWRYKWSASAGATNGSQCANCHGDFTSGWTTGTVHATYSTRGNGAHTEAGSAGFPCTDCHSLGTTNGAYTYAVTSNDWLATDSGATTKHGDGFITMNSTSTTWSRNTGRSGCSGCHEGATGTANAHDYAAAALTSQTVAGDAPNVAGGCTTCHGDTAGGTEFAPDGSAYPDRAGQHSAHVTAIALKLGGDTLSNRNASCDYCHPNPGEAGHNDNISPANLHSTGNFKYIVGGAVDPGSLYNGPAADTCASVACHGNAPFTPHWYPDTVAPAAIANLAVTNSGADVEPGTLKLTWTAPGNDNNNDGKAYEYDVRYSTGAISAGNFAAAPRAGHAPTVSRQGKTETMALEGLTPGTSYFVAVKTRDETGNWATISNLPAALAAKTDTVTPTFYGIETAVAGDESGTVELRWNPAIDTSLPISYKIWWSTGTINYGAAPNATTQGLSYRLTGLPVGVLYNFAVRAMDSAAVPNTETNVFTKSLMAKTAPAVPITKATYRANSVQTGTAPNLSATLGAAFANPVTSLSVAINTAVTWRTTTTYSRDTNVTGISYEFRVQDSGNTGQDITYEMGYCDASGANYVSLGTAKNMLIGRRSNRVRKLPLNSFTGTIPAAKVLAVKVTNTGSANQTWSWGTATTSQGVLIVNEQAYNHLPNTFTLNPPSGSGVVNISWNATTDSDGDPAHYDVFGSTDNGVTWPHIIATGLSGTSTSWNTVTAGVALSGANSQVRVMVAAGDGQQIGSGAGTSHTEILSAAWSVNNSVDSIAPATVNDLHVDTRPKQGSVYLRWTAPGNDELFGRAQSYDVRYSTSAINAGNFASATPAVAIPSPEIAGEEEHLEIVGLNIATPYWFAVKAGDGTNWSAISNVVSTNSGNKCGICHATPPDDAASNGKHTKHGYTVADCTKCHGDTILTYALDHQDGQLEMGFGRDTGGVKLATVTATIAGSNVSYWQDPDGAGALPSVKIYEDTSGAGGFNLTSGDGVDNGTCMNFNGVNATGCHGPATPTWNEASTLACSACHGTSSRTTDSYGRKYDDVMRNGANNKVIAAPPVDNHGLSTGKYVGQHEKHLNFSFRFSKGDSCRLCHLDNDHASGVIDVVLDLTAAGDSTVWTPNASGAGTPGTCAGTSQITCHGVSTSPSWDSATTLGCNSCHGMNGKTFTVGAATSQIGHVTDGGQVRACTWCHVGGHPQDRPVLAVTKGTPAVITTANEHGLNSGDSIVMHVPNGMTQLDGWSGVVTVTGATTFTIPVNTTTYSNFTSGFWTLGIDSGTLLIPNNSAVGIDYRSGGIHLLKTINGRGPYSTEAEICWGCHDAQSTKVSEWGVNNGNTAPTGNSPYSYGLIGGATTTAKWYATATTGASWSSAKFTYKTGAIQSTHSTNPDGGSAVTGSDFAKTETVDPVQKIRCSNCHDLHDRNLAANDTVTGTPYLRGTWMGNPYEEDGAPLSTTTYVDVPVGSYGFGAVPRGGTGYRRLGGYFIDQNNAVPGTASATVNGTANFNPTASWTLDSSAGLCTLCHGTDVDNLDQTTGENLWLGTNGHSNSAIGGTFTNAANIFDQGAGTASISGRPTAVSTTSVSKTTQVPDMAYQSQGSSATTRGFGYRGTTGGSNAGGYTPVTATLYAHYAYDWGATVDATTIDVNFHNFSCSKCHNPHASRLPKLLITNCLDIKKNTWDDNKTVQSQYTAATLTDVDRFGGTGQRSAYYASAQNCHRYNNLRTATNKGGWNKVSPW